MLEEKLSRLRRFNAAVRRADPKLAEESLATIEFEAESAAPGSIEAEIRLESIVMRRERPVLAIKQKEAELVFTDPLESEIWKARLEKAKPMLAMAIPAIGRIELRGGQFAWIGTGWLVRNDILVTNRHVAREFVARDGEGLNFRMGDAGRMRAAVDFLQEIDNPNTLVFKILEPLDIEPEPGPDVAFFRVAPIAGNERLAEPIRLARTIALTESAATIGYPGYDSRIPEPALMEQIYGRIYDKKRLAPGGVTRIEATRLWHNCTTLGGCSGGAVIALDTGEAIGLHFSGSFLTTNYAVRADVVQSLLDRIGRPRSQPRRPQGPTVAPPAIETQAGQASVTVPLTITVSVGGQGSPQVSLAQPFPAPVDSGPDAIEGEEARVEDYRDRQGYRKEFLDFEIPLPSVERDAADVLTFSLEGRAETELRYEHYSVVMSRSRRMCFFSAVNIDGGLSRKTKRVGWKWDPRIERGQQIMNECYGDPPRFSRGHMTRREDPAWGEEAIAKRGNQDSMHVTNTTPQMQSFNSPIWLALEDYALEHAREDAMKISVFTGPYFTDRDPLMYGVRIPRSFWKVIAFIHDETGQLCATGYEMNQERNLPPEEEFVFGGFTSPQLGIATQVQIGSIELRSGISFGGLAGLDPLTTGEEAAVQESRSRILRTMEQIRFSA